MTNKEYVDRNICLTFDLLREVIKSPSVLESIPYNDVIGCIEKDFKKTEHPDSIKPDIYIKVRNQFELI